jgi:hypothetical protein
VLIPPLQSGGLGNDKLKGFTSYIIRSIGDENDANAINRVNQIPQSEQENNPPLKSATTRPSRPSSVTLKTLKPVGTAQIPASASVQEDDDLAATAALKKSSGNLKSILQPTQSLGNRLEKVRTSIGSKPLSSGTISSTGVSTRSSRLHSTSHKFEVYDESNNTKERSSPKSIASTSRRPLFDVKSLKDDSKKPIKTDGYLSRHMVHRPSTTPPTATDKAMDELQHDLESIHLAPSSNMTAPDTKRVASIASPAPYPVKVATQQAWMTTATPAPSNPVNHEELHTPEDQIITEPKEPKGTLEEMHDMLDHSYINNTNFQSIINKKGLDSSLPASAAASHRAIATKQSSASEIATKVWVVRYVDYTSKYGLGFLLNTGSTGVYFNDSTKIIVSADGTIFQYIERVKKNKESASTSTESYHVQTHLITAYPVELQKKVTLLRHFRNYLIEQQRLCARSHSQAMNQEEPDVQLEDIYGGGPTVGDEVQSLPMLPDNGTSSGANAMIKFGQSSVKYQHPSAHHADDKAEVELPYVKKWVRTKHAILFRMSNRTVQVLFFDKR